MNTEIGILDVAGTDGDGFITLFAAVVVLFLGYVGASGGAEGRWWTTAAVVVSIFGLALATHHAMNISDFAEDATFEFGDPRVAYGLVVCIGGFAVSAVGFLSGRKKQLSEA